VHHPRSVVRPVLDYIAIALARVGGEVIIGDAQVIFFSAIFDEAMAISQIDQLVTWYQTQTPVSPRVV